MTASSDTNAHTTISKLRSRFGALGKNGLGRGSHPTAAAAAAAPPSPANKTHDGKDAQKETSLNQGAGIDYSLKARNFVVKNALRHLYPNIDPFKSGMLKVDDRHEVYYEVCGNEKGAPGEHEETEHVGKGCADDSSLVVAVVFLHGGPGASSAS